MRVEEAVEYLKNISGTNIEFNEDDFVEFDVEDGGIAIAVDGSSVRLFDAYTFSVYARRVGWVKASEEKLLYKNKGELKIDYIFGENADAVNDGRREKEELEIAKKFTDTLVMIDGCANIKEKNVVGISKKSGMKIGNAPLLFVAKKYGDKIKPGKRWYYQMNDGVYAVKFHPYSKFAFRVDYYGDDAKEVFSKIASFCSDISCLGYPYPLAEVHKMVKIDADEADYLRYSILHGAVRRGISMDELENLFYDYHEYMEG